jgi:hypothetical protein
MKSSASRYERPSGGVLRMAQGDLVGARENYDTAIRPKSDFGEAFYNRRWLALTASEDSWGIDSRELRALFEAVATYLRIPGTRARTETGGDDAARID